MADPSSIELTVVAWAFRSLGAATLALALYIWRALRREIDGMQRAGELRGQTQEAHTAKLLVIESENRQMRRQLEVMDAKLDDLLMNGRRLRRLLKDEGRDE